MKEKSKGKYKGVNDGDRESEIQADKSVADDDQESEGKMNILRELNVLKKTSLLREEFQVNWGYSEDRLEAKAAWYNQDEIVNEVIRAMVPGFTLRNVLETTTDLSLDKFLNFLEIHFEEKSTTYL